MKELDLHGVLHEDVPNTIKRFLEDILRTEAEHNYKIITGNSKRMRELVVCEIALYEIFHWYFEPGCVIIYVKD